MAEEIKDKLAERIRLRREANERARSGEQAVLPAISHATLAHQESKPEPNREFNPAITEVNNAIAAGENPIKIARMLTAILAGEVTRKELFVGLGKSEGWLSKRLGLLNAPKDIQRLIEESELTESEYYDNRQNVKAGIHGRGESLRYQRMPTVTISIEAAKALASMLQDLAAQLGAAPIRFDEKSNKKDITGILNQRAGEIRGIFKK
jgi:hypothetical protein